MSQDTPLHAAALNGDLEACKRLLAEGADIHARSYMDYTPFHEAAQGGHLEVIQLFLENGGDVNIRHAERGMPIHEAARFGHADVCEQLVRAGCDIEAKGFEDRTALHYAALNGQPEVAERLLGLGADVHASSVYPSVRVRGVTPLHLAANDGNIMPNESTGKQVQVARMLLAAGADPDALAKQDYRMHETDPLPALSPLHYARSASAVHALMDHGANPDLSSVWMVKLLPVGGPTDRGTPCPLKAHANAGHVDVVEALVQRGASLDTKDGNGITARDHIKGAGMGIVLAKEEAMKRNAQLEALLPQVNQADDWHPGMTAPAIAAPEATDSSEQQQIQTRSRSQGLRF